MSTEKEHPEITAQREGFGEIHQQAWFNCCGSTYRCGWHDGKNYARRAVSDVMQKLEGLVVEMGDDDRDGPQPMIHWADLKRALGKEINL